MVQCRRVTILLYMCLIAGITVAQQPVASSGRSPTSVDPLQASKLESQQKVHRSGGVYRNPDHSMVVVIPAVEQRNVVRDEHHVGPDANGKTMVHYNKETVLTMADGTTIPQRVIGMRSLKKGEMDAISKRVQAGLTVNQAIKASRKPSPAPVRSHHAPERQVRSDGTAIITYRNRGKAGSLSDF